MKTLCLKLSEALDAQLAATARKRGQSKSAVVRAILDESLSQGAPAAKGSCLELAADLAGCVEGPCDLSANQRHLRGYGR
jgi:predicted transcriptional regulator